MAQSRLSTNNPQFRPQQHLRAVRNSVVSTFAYWFGFLTEQKALCVKCSISPRKVLRRTDYFFSAAFAYFELFLSLTVVV